MTEQFWPLLRYLLIALGAYLTGRGIIPAGQATTLIDQIMNVLPALVAVATAIWGVYVKWNTKTVLKATTISLELPTVSAATGAAVPPKP